MPGMTTVPFTPAAVVPTPSTAGNLLLQWQDSTGVWRALDGSLGVTALLGASGLFMPPFNAIEQNIPLLAGARLRYVQTAARSFDLPLLIKGTSYSDLWKKLRSVMTWFDPTQPRGTTTTVPWDGNGALQVTAPDGSARVLNCYYTDGLELVMDEQNSGGSGYQLATVGLHAADPYWYDTAATVANATTCATNTLTAATVTTGGDVECWPIWTVKFTVAASQAQFTLNVTITDTTTGYSLLLTGLVIAATGGSPVAHTVIIDTRPTVKTITLDGVNAFYSLAVSGFAVLYPLAAGANVMNYTIAMAPTPTLTTTSSVQVTYTNRYNTP